jgi:ankyrin repeat protein
LLFYFDFLILKSQKVNFVNMLSTRFLFLQVLILISSFILQVEIFAQEEVAADTSDYVPYYYNKALENNLMIAASKGNDAEVERLLRKGADIDEGTFEGATPLIFAVANNHPGTVKILLAHNPNVNCMTVRGETPLSIAVKNQKAEIAEALIRSGAEIDQADKDGVTPLHYSAINGSFDLTDLLLYYDADCNKKSDDGTTPLMAAIWSGFDDVADLLIVNGANLEARDNEGFTPLLLAAQNGDTMMIDRLLRDSVNIYEKNIYNYNALALAIEANQMPALEFLLSKGDKWTTADNQAVNPYRVASAFGRIDMIKILEKNNISGRQGLRIDEVSFSVSTRANFRDFFTGASISFKEPTTNAGFIFGCDIKPVYTRVLMKTGENHYFQYFDRSAMVYAGIFRDFTLAEYRPGAKLAFSPSLSAGYSLGSKFKGTSLSPGNKLRIIPAVSLKLQVNHLIFTSGIDYTDTDFYKIGPLWLRIGFAYNFFLSNSRSPVKNIKWY